MTKYISTVSPFILQKIKTTPWSNRSYINDLLKIRNWIINEPKGFICGQHFWHFRNKYPQEYLALLEEINPEKYRNVLTQSQGDLFQQWNLLKEQKAIKKAEEAKEMEEYQEWMALGDSVIY